jgi:NitT/TauT family transport system ATP-binding protein
MSFISIKHVWKEYGDRVVLENISLDIAQGEFVSIVGASGCGKTTFFKMLLGEETPSRGEMFLNGKRWPQEPGADRGVVFQRYSVFPHLTAIQNVVLGLEFRDAKITTRLLGSKKSAAMEQAQAMLEAVGLGNNSHKYPHQLSGGMQQRLALAQSLIREPEILLLDEPFGALDPGIRADMHALLLSLWQEKQFSVFMVTHDIQEGFTLGTRLLVFDRVRNDPHEPDAYGAKISYDIPLKQKRKWTPA